MSNHGFGLCLPKKCIPQCTEGKLKKDISPFFLFLYKPLMNEQSPRSSILSSTGFQLGKTSWEVLSTALEPSRRKANFVAQGDGKFASCPWGGLQNPSKPKKKTRCWWRNKTWGLLHLQLYETPLCNGPMRVTDLHWHQKSRMAEVHQWPAWHTWRWTEWLSSIKSRCRPLFSVLRKQNFISIYKPCGANQCQTREFAVGLCPKKCHQYGYP